jgi:UDP-N-acetylglucosamine 2-epimerase
LTDDVVYEAMANATNPYGDGRAAHKIVDVLAATATDRSRTRAELDSDSYEHSDRPLHESAVA